MPPLRLAIIGCGLATRLLHFPALQRLKRKFVIAVVCNHTAQKAREFSKLAGGVPYVLDYRDVLADPSIDAVDVSLPIELNLPVTRDALKAGKHVIVEKPLAATMAECREMVRLSQRTKLVTMVAENFRYRPAIRKLRKMIDDGRFGEVYAVQWMVSSHTVATSLWGTPWRLDHKYPGGYPMDAGVHYVHALRYLFGEITRVNSWTASVNPAIGSVDTHNMEFDTASGAHGVYCHYFSTHMPYSDRLCIYGRAASGVLEYGRLTIHRTRAKPRTVDMKNDEGYVGEFTAFHSAITKGAAVEASFEEGLRDFRVIERSLKSAKVGTSLTVG